MTEELKDTPAAEWRELGEADPHKGHYDKMRKDLTLGHFSDDALANLVFMNYDCRPNFQDILDRKPGVYMPIVWMTAAKERIRWLSRRVCKLEAELAAAAASMNKALQIAGWLDSFGELHKRKEDAWDGDPESTPPRPVWTRIEPEETK